MKKSKIKVLGQNHYTDHIIRKMSVKPKAADSDRELLITKLIKSSEIKKIYDDYIVKEIPFETWVRDKVDYLLVFKQELKQ